MTQPGESAISDQEIVIDYVIERSSEIRDTLADLQEIADNHGLEIGRHLEGAAQSLYRAERELAE